MKKRRIAALLLPALLPAVLTGCGKTSPDNGALWQAAMQDAVFSEDEELHELVALTRDDSRVIWDEAGERVLLLSWHDYDDACAPGTSIRTEFGDIWAVSASEMQAWYEQNHRGVENWDLRFAQLLGVHADEGYTRFTAFWVSPKDVIRPAYVTDVTRQMENDYAAVTEEAYKEWFDANILWSYFESDYPWTRLGYTYDWSGGGSEYGLTEFLVADGSKTEIAFTLPTAEFVDRLEDRP